MRPGCLAALLLCCCVISNEKSLTMYCDAPGKFSQFYYWDDYYYKGPGSPVVFFTPGEIDVTNYYTYLTMNRTTGVIAKEIGAAVVVLERMNSPVSLNGEEILVLTCYRPILGPVVAI